MESSVANTNVWSNVLHSVERQLNRQIFDAWFRPIKFNGCDDDRKVLYLSASQINKDWIKSNYSDLIDQTLADLDLANYSLKWQVEESGGAEKAVPELDALEDFEDSGDDDEPASETVYQKDKTRFVDLEPIENSLNRKYTFETFVVGSCNQFAHAAAEAVVDQPGKAYNPMFIYGGVGLGKTHLMHAIGHAIGLRNRHLRVAYISAEKFMNELINAIRYDKTQTFRDKYRSIDVLLMDDVQFMAGKERTQ